MCPYFLDCHGTYRIFWINFLHCNFPDNAFSSFGLFEHLSKVHKELWVKLTFGNTLFIKVQTQWCVAACLNFLLHTKASKNHKSFAKTVYYILLGAATQSLALILLTPKEWKFEQKLCKSGCETLKCNVAKQPANQTYSVTIQIFLSIDGIILILTLIIIF